MTLKNAEYKNFLSKENFLSKMQSVKVSKASDPEELVELHKQN